MSLSNKKIGNKSYYELNVQGVQFQVALLGVCSHRSHVSLCCTVIGYNLSHHTWKYLVGIPVEVNG